MGLPKAERFLIISILRIRIPLLLTLLNDNWRVLFVRVARSRLATQQSCIISQCQQRWRFARVRMDMKTVMMSSPTVLCMMTKPTSEQWLLLQEHRRITSLSRCQKQLPKRVLHARKNTNLDKPQHRSIAGGHAKIRHVQLS